MLYYLDVSEDDETDADDVPKVVNDIKDIFTKMQEAINTSEETSKLIERIQKVYIDKIEPKLCDSYDDYYG